MPGPMPDDDAVLELLRRGDPRAAAQLLEVFGDRVYGLALRILGSEADAQEAVQETFLSVWHKWPSFQEKSRFASWVYRIAANHAYMMLRRRRRSDESVSLDEEMPEDDGSTEPRLGAAVLRSLASPGNTPAGALQQRELAAVVQAAMTALSPTYRVAYMLKEVDGLGLKEIAEVMSLSEAAVKTRVHRARLELRRCLAPYLKD